MKLKAVDFKGEILFDKLAECGFNLDSAWKHYNYSASTYKCSPVYDKRLAHAVEVEKMTNVYSSRVNICYSMQRV